LLCFQLHLTASHLHQRTCL